MNIRLIAILAVLEMSTGVIRGQDKAAEPVTTAPTVIIAPECGLCCEPRGWMSGEYLLWWIKDGSQGPPLVTGVPGPLGAGAQVLAGGGDWDYGPFSGFRLTAGSWIDSDRLFGFEVGFFWMGAEEVDFTVAANTAIPPNPPNPLLFVPFFNVATNLEDAVALNPANPGVSQSTASVSVLTRSQLWGFEVNGVVNAWRDGGITLDLLLGYRYLDLQEKQQMVYSQRTSDDPQPPGIPVTLSVLSATDLFDTRCQFNGGQFGGRLTLQGGRGYLMASGKVALGATHEVLNIHGTTVVAGVGAGVFPGGIFALPSNIGRSETDRFAVLPEVGVKAGWEWRRGLRTFIGYDFLYLSSVARPGDQINRNLNPGQSSSPLFQGAGGPPPFVPLRSIQSADFFAHGLNVGVEIRY